MKQLLRTLVIGSLAAASVAVATVGYFSSNVTATGNIISTGTLRSAIDTTAIGGGNAGYVVAYDNNGVVTLGTPFGALTNVQPGETRSVYFTVRNIGTLAFDYRAYFAGTWGDTALDNQNVITATQVHRFPTGNCSGDIECEDIYYWLTGLGYPNYGVAYDFGSIGVVRPEPTGTSWFGHASALSDGVNTLQPNQFTIFRVDFTMSTAAGNDFQGKTFTYSLDSFTKQTTAPTF